MAVRVGSGPFVYEVDERWGQLPASWSLVDVVGVVTDSADRVYVFNRGSHPMIVFEPDGRLADAWGEGVFTNPHGLQIGPDGSIYTVDNGDHTVRKFTPDGKQLMLLGTPGKRSDTGWSGSFDTLRGGPPFNAPTNIAIAPDNSLYVTDGYGNCKVHHFSPTGELLGSFGEAGTGPGQFRLVHGICITLGGMVYVGDRVNDRVQIFDLDGNFKREWRGVRQPDEIHHGRDGFFYVAELGNQSIDNGLGARITVRNAAGEILTAWGDEGDPTAAGNFAAPHGCCIDSQGTLYVGEVSYTSRVSTKVLKPSCHCFQRFVRVR